MSTFLEGMVLIVVAIVAAILSHLLGIDWLATIAPVLFAAGIAYASGGAAGKAQLKSELRRDFHFDLDRLKKLSGK